MFSGARAGPSMAGFGRIAHRHGSGRTGESLVTGVSPRRAAFSLDVMPGAHDHGAILDRPGPHRMGRSWLCITRLEAVERRVLAGRVRSGLTDLDAMWPARPEQGTSRPRPA